MNNGAPNLGGGIDLQKVAAQRQQFEAHVSDMNLNVAMHIYAKLAGDIVQNTLKSGSDEYPEAQLRDAAARAKLVAPYLAESFGFIQEYKVTVKKSDTQSAD